MEVNRSYPPNILFEITPTILNFYSERPVLFTKPPYLLAFYETNYENVGRANKIRYLKIPQLPQYPFDLNDGYELYRTHESGVLRYIQILEKYIMSSASHGNGGNDERTTVYTRRATLTSIMESNYVKNNNWIIRVTRYNGDLYMVKTYDPYLSSNREKKQTHHIRMEKILFSDSPYELPEINEPYDDNIKLIGVHRSSLGKYDIVYEGEIPGIIAEEKLEDFNDLEALNKCRFVLSKQLWNNLSHNNIRWLKYWLHAYLTNVEEIYVAFKNIDGVVEEPIECKIVSDIPKNRFWKPKICTGFLHDFLEHVEKLMSNVNCLNTVYDFHFSSDFKDITYEIYEGKTEKTFLTNEYIDFCKNKNVN